MISRFPLRPLACIALIGLAMLFLAAALAGCRATKPLPDGPGHVTENVTGVTAPLPDIDVWQSNLSTNPAEIDTSQKCVDPALLSQAGAAPITSRPSEPEPKRSDYGPGLGGSLQYKLDAASWAKKAAGLSGAPGKLKNSTYAPGATGTVVNAPKAQAPVSGTGPAVDNTKAKAPSAVLHGDGNVATQTDIGKNKAPAATAAGATATETKQSGLSWWWLVVPVAVGGFLLYKRFTA